MQLGGLILAGGRSQRMGQDKALLELSGRPLLRRTWDVAQALTTSVWIVTPHRDRYQPYLPPTAQWIEEVPVRPDEPGPGPLQAFAQALPQVASADWILLLACDMPKLQANTLRQWSRNLSQLPPTAIAYLPQTNQGWEPLCGFYRPSCGASMRTYLATGQRSFQAWLDQSHVVPILPVPDEILTNCNTPEDWQSLQQAQ
ncbi:MAG: molybdenum cofactor guanylyltransferase [Leptolyngbyaceae cyanobacterium]